MKILLDENLPKRLKKDLSGHLVFTVRDKNWNGIKNGLLLKLMLSDGFEVFITFDKNMQFQQNFEKYAIPVIVLNAENNTYLALVKLLHQMLTLLNGDLKSGINLIQKDK